MKEIELKALFAVVAGEGETGVSAPTFVIPTPPPPPSPPPPQPIYPGGNPSQSVPGGGDPTLNITYPAPAPPRAPAPSPPGNPMPSGPDPQRDPLYYGA